MADDPKTYTQEQVDEMLAGLKTKNSELIAAEKRAQAALKNYDGVDPEEYKTLKAAAAEAERKRAAAEGDFESLKKQLIDQHAGEIGKRDTRIATLTAALEKRLIDADAAGAIAAAKGSVKGLLPHARPHLKVFEEDGEFVARVVDAKGNVRIADGKGTPMAIADLVAEMKNDAELARLFEGSGSSGGGATKSGTATQPGYVPATFDAFSANLDKIAKGEIKVTMS